MDQQIGGQYPLPLVWQTQPLPVGDGGDQGGGHQQKQEGQWCECDVGHHDEEKDCGDPKKRRQEKSEEGAGEERTNQEESGEQGQWPRVVRGEEGAQKGGG